MKAKLWFLTGGLITLLGVGLNNLVYHANGYMPFKGVWASGSLIIIDGRSPINPASRLVFLADILPGGLSLGDCLIVVGSVVLMISLVVICRISREVWNICSKGVLFEKTN